MAVGTFIWELFPVNDFHLPNRGAAFLKGQNSLCGGLGAKRPCVVALPRLGRDASCPTSQILKRWPP